MAFLFMLLLERNGDKKNNVLGQIGTSLTVQEAGEAGEETQAQIQLSRQQTAGGRSLRGCWKHLGPGHSRRLRWRGCTWLGASTGWILEVGALPDSTEKENFLQGHGPRVQPQVKQLSGIEGGF